MNVESELIIIANSIAQNPLPTIEDEDRVGRWVHLEWCDWSAEARNEMSKLFSNSNNPNHRRDREYRNFLRQPQNSATEEDVLVNMPKAYTDKKILVAKDPTEYNRTIAVIHRQCTSMPAHEQFTELLGMLASVHNPFGMLFRPAMLHASPAEREESVYALIRSRLVRRLNASGLRIIVGFPSLNGLGVMARNRIQKREGRAFRNQLLDTAALNAANMVHWAQREVWVVVGVKRLDLRQFPLGVLIDVFRMVISKI